MEGVGALVPNSCRTHGTNSMDAPTHSSLANSTGPKLRDSVLVVVRLWRTFTTKQWTISSQFCQTERLRGLECLIPHMRHGGSGSAVKIESTIASAVDNPTTSTTASTALTSTSAISSAGTISAAITLVLSSVKRSSSTFAAAT